MSIKRKKTPQLLALLICEKVYLDEDKVATLMRVVDTFSYDIVIEGASEEELRKVSTTVDCVVFSRWGPGVGSFREELRFVGADGKEVKSVVPPTEFKMLAGFHFQQVRHHVTLVINQPGLYSWRIYLDGVLKGEHPFMVNINRKSVPSSRPKPGRQ